VIYCRSLDLDPTAEDREERAHRGSYRRRGPADLEVNGGVVPAVFETSGSGDGVQEETAKIMVRRRRRGFPGMEVGHDRRLMAGRGGPGHGDEQCRQKLLGSENLTRRCRTSRRSRWRSRRGREALVLRRFHARVAPAFGTIWTRMGPSFCSARGHKIMSGGCSRDPQIRWSRREGTGWPHLTVIADGGCRFPRDPVLCCGQPGGRERGEKGCRRGGDRAAFIGVVVRCNRQGINRID
jgi:hypothetical protein